MPMFSTKPSHEQDLFPCQGCRAKEGNLYKISINGVLHYLNMCLDCLDNYRTFGMKGDRP